MTDRDYEAPLRAESTEALPPAEAEDEPVAEDAALAGLGASAEPAFAQTAENVPEQELGPLPDDMTVEEAGLAAAAEAPLELDDENRLNTVIENLCHSKASEFRMLGYEYVSGKDIWDCVSEKYEKTGIPGLHRIVNDILSLKTTQFMNWMTMRAYKGGSF